MTIGALGAVALQAFLILAADPPTLLILLVASAVMWQITKALQWPALLASRRRGERYGPWVFVIALGIAVGLLTDVILLALP